MDAASALAELKDLSTQIEVVVLAYRSGEVKASTAPGPVAERLGKLGAEIVEHADQVRRDLGRDGVSQLQVATPDGSLFIVIDANLMALATTAPDPTAGLVFYDLKTLLRQIDDGDSAGATPAADEPEAAVAAEGDADADADAEKAEEDSDA